MIDICHRRKIYFGYIVSNIYLNVNIIENKKYVNYYYFYD